MAILRSFLLGAAVAGIVLQSTGASDAVRIDGGDEFGWEENRWYVQVDGVMGGKSSGKMEFTSSTNAMKFTGDISLDGGGFSSVRRQIDIDLSEYAGVVVTLEADARSAGNGAVSPPTGLHLQFDDRTSRYDFSSAFAIPLSSSNNDDPVVTSVYLPVESFDRATTFGFECGSGCQFDESAVRGMSVYVLFQEGSFDVRLRSIEAVMEPRTFAPPACDILESKDDVVGLIQSTISSGGSLYDKSYSELCIAMYWSVLNTVLSSDSRVVSGPVQAVICAGLQEVEDQMEDGDSKADIAWTLRHAMDSVIADLQGSSRTTTQDWLPTVSEAASMDVNCVGRTSAAPGLMYDPTNEFIVVSDSEDNEREPLNGNEEEASNESEANEKEEVSPIISPTIKPTASPTARPTGGPTAKPTVSPSVRPTSSPTASPTANPEIPTVSPTVRPTANPTASPGVSPTARLTTNPTASSSNSENGEQVGETLTGIGAEEKEPLGGNEEVSTLASDEILLKDPVIVASTVESSGLSSGYSSLLRHGFGSVVFGILLLEVVQLVC